MRGKTGLAALFTGVALGAAACGGSVGAGSGGGDASGIAPADSIAFVSVDTDLGSGQWKALDELTGKFPIKAKAIAMLEQSMQKDGVDFEKDVRPALGSEVDVAVLGVSRGNLDAVGMTKPRDRQAFDALLAKLDASDSTSPKTLHEQVDGWTVFADKQSAIDAVKQASTSGHSLADVSAFKDAMSEVSSDALAKAYVNGPAVEKLLPGSGMLAAATTPQLDWLAARVSATSNSLELYGAANGTAEKLKPYSPKLLAGVPSGALVYASWRDLASTLQRGSIPTNSPGFDFFRTLFGIRVQDLLPLLRGEGAFWLTAGAPIPEFALELEESNDAQARTTMTKLAHGLAKLSGQKLGTQQTSAGPVPTLSVGPVTILFAVANGRVVVTNSQQALKPSGPSLAGDPSFKQALKDAGAPDQTLGLLYVNVKDALPLLTGLSALGGGPQLPAQDQANLDALRYLVAYGTVSGSTTRSKVFVETR